MEEWYGRKKRQTSGQLVEIKGRQCKIFARENKQSRYILLVSLWKTMLELVWLKALFHPACLARVVSWFAFVVTIFMAHENGDKQRETKSRHVQGMLDETEPLRLKYKLTSCCRLTRLYVVVSLFTWTDIATTTTYSQTLAETVKFRTDSIWNLSAAPQKVRLNIVGVSFTLSLLCTFEHSTNVSICRSIRILF